MHALASRPQLRTRVLYATPHNYYLPPFGPFRRFEVAPNHHAMLQRLDALLSPCVHHCEYLQRWGPSGLTTRPLYAADYHYFHEESGEGGGSEGGGGSKGSAASALPDLSDSLAPFNGHPSNGHPTTTASSRSVHLPPAMSPWLAPHKFVTLVSPSPEKGLAVFSTLARRMPHVQFAAVATQWTGAETVAKLQSLGPNVTILPAHPNVDVIFRQTKVLIAPSLWQECCPLIVMEACLRAIPCVSSDVFGLPEANANGALLTSRPRHSSSPLTRPTRPNPGNLVVHASLCYDHARGILHHSTTNAQLEARYGNSPPPLPSAAERAANVSRATKEEASARGVQRATHTSHS